MKLTFKTNDLLPCLKQVASVVNSKNSMPILDNILFEYKNGVLYLTASDSEVWLSVKASGVENNEGEDVRFCVNAQNILKAFQNLTDTTVSIEIKEGSNVLNCEYTNGHFSLPYNGTDEFPMPNQELTEVTERIIGAQKIARLIAKVGFATAHDELRPVLNGVNFDFFKEHLVGVSTDGHKLARYQDASITHDVELVPHFTLPKKPATILLNILSDINQDVRLRFDKKVVVVSNEAFKLTARLIEGRFPNYNSVIPKDSPVKVNISKNALLQALKRVLPMSDTQSELVKLDFTMGTVTICAEDIDFSKQAKENVSCDYKDSPMAIGFKGSSLIEILRTIDDDDVVMEMENPSRACIFYGSQSTKDEYMSLVMPMLIN